MRLLPTRLTLREIASELFVSQNTLKFHLRVIYRKLGVNSRAEAVETARRLRSPGSQLGPASYGVAGRPSPAGARTRSADSTPRSTRCSKRPQLVDPVHAPRRGRIRPAPASSTGAAAQQVDVTSSRGGDALS